MHTCAAARCGWQDKHHTTLSTADWQSFSTSTTPRRSADLRTGQISHDTEQFRMQSFWCSMTLSWVADLRAVEDQLAGPLQDPLAALSNSVGSQGLARQLVQGAPDDPLHLAHPQLHRPCQAGVHCLQPVNLLTWTMCITCAAVHSLPSSG